MTPFTPDITSTRGAGLTREVAQFVIDSKYEAIPENVITLGKKSILDGIGLALAGSVADSGVLVQKYLRSQGLASGSATVIGTDLKVPERFAAFANGVGIHADDYDDTQLAVGADRVYGLLTHPTAPALPPALAIAESGDLSGKELMLAYHLGVEVECKIAEAISPRHYQHGFHTTATVGTLAAAVAAGKLRALDLERMLCALGIAASQAAGLRENFGTMTKPFHAGRAAESGVGAADLARLGWTATDKILESPRGFFQAHGGGYDLDSIRGKLGNPWTFAWPGVSIKPHPCGSLTHPGMTKMLELVLANDLRPEQVERINVGTNHNMPNALIHHRPTTSLQGKFSMEFCIAILLLERRAGLAEFTDERVNRPDVRSVIEKINFHVHPGAEAAGYDKMTTIIEIRCKDGRTISGRADFGKGSPSNPMSYDEVAAKFRDCAAFAGWPGAKAGAIVEIVASLERLENVKRLTKLLQ
ncbi:MAG: MmgE/PrpD family protein [Acidobacteria bacterium]|nr:MmgE/PrpD family protein [Acidobacteriota bacterium]